MIILIIIQTINQATVAKEIGIYSTKTTNIQLDQIKEDLLSIPIRNLPIQTKEIVNFIKSLNIKVDENNTTILNGKELDIYIPSHNVAIEYDGLYWHSEQFINDDYHLIKTELCE